MTRNASFRPEYILPGTRIGSYEIQTQIGQGTGAVVYDAVGPDGVHYALKVSRYQATSRLDLNLGTLGHAARRHSTSTMMVRRFVRSIQCHLQLRFSPNVAKIVAHGWYPSPGEGWPYMVQELVPGGSSITEWARETSPTLRRILSAFRDLAGACSEMSRAGIVHRNLTPANVLMTRDGVPKIIGFHSATHWQAEILTFPEAGGQPGSVLSLSPELCKAIILERTTGKEMPFSPGPAGDLHALGCILYEVLVGAHPFDIGEGGLELLRAIAHRAPRRPSVLNPSIPREVSEVVMGMLWKIPEERYSDGEQVAILLENQMAQEDARLDQPLAASGSLRLRLRLVRPDKASMPAGEAITPPTT